MKKLICTILSLVTILCICLIPANASIKQTETYNYRQSSNGSWWIKAYAAFDRMATVQSNANKWNYKGSSTVHNPPSKGTNTLKITSTATVKCSSSISMAGGSKSASASASKTWQAVTATWSKSKSMAKGDKSDTPNSEINVLLIQPRKYYNAGTAGIIVTASFTRADTKATYSTATAA